MYCASYVVIIALLRERNWHVCKKCGFEQNVERFKNTLFCR